MASPVGIILCGRMAHVAMPVIKGLLPKYEVIHVILSPEAGVVEITMILDGKVPPATEPPNIGSQDYSKSPVAVVAGRGYDDAAMKLLRDACKGKRGINWVTADMTVPAPTPGGPSYPDHIVGRVVACLDALAEKGELHGEGLHLY